MQSNFTILDLDKTATGFRIDPENIIVVDHRIATVASMINVPAYFLFRKRAKKGLNLKFT